jgi:hypothetical protein
VPTITHSQAIEAKDALLALAQLENIPAIPTGMAIRQGVRILNPICEDVEQERLKLGEKYIERDEEGNKVVGETNPDGTPRTWKIADTGAFTKDLNELYNAEVEVAWSIPSSFFKGSSPKPMLLIALGDLLIDEKGE